MKIPTRRSLFAAAALVAAGTVSAQSSVTLFGVLDASVSRYTVGRGTGNGPTAFPRSQTVLANGANAPSRLGFRGTEDLGGGLAAGFWLEGPLGNDSGSTETRPYDFSRRSTVSLSGGFGEMRLGRDNTPTDWNDVLYSPFGPLSVGSSVALQAAGLNLASRAFLPGDVNAVRASNSIGYFLPPDLGGLYGQFMYTLHENVQTGTDPANRSLPDIGSTKGRYAGGRLGYAKGALDIALGYAESTLGNLAGTVAAPYGFGQLAAAYDAKVRTVNLGASYDLGMVQLMGELSQVSTRFAQPAIPNPQGGLPLRSGVADSTRNRSWVLGATVPIGAGLIKLSWSRLKIRWPEMAGLRPPEPGYGKFAIGYVHNLSRRTALYATAARLSNRNGAALPIGGGGNSASPIKGAPNARSTGYELGVRHAF